MAFISVILSPIYPATFIYCARKGQLPIFVLKASEKSICREFCLDI